ncbi:hypothetical protein N7533_007910 [Penicillium manginii]|uniref:uncharacterized protein n=1 Tax=Penicillium manginii TaxID=203109 RepID=UPI002549B3BC|nr:uncharacterized protein N7533_007910 [Penicillium manginii]KAJ5750882.1 hypothetical protein N7533_007910 [Penicillium manginii]
MDTGWGLDWRDEGSRSRGSKRGICGVWVVGMQDPIDVRGKKTDSNSDSDADADADTDADADSYIVSRMRENGKSKVRVKQSPAA